MFFRSRDYAVALDTNLTPELVEEGFVREIISKVQTMRKESGFEILDRITLYHDGSDRIASVIQNHETLIKEEVLAIAIEQGSHPDAKEWDINGETCRLKVVRVISPDQGG